jgi:peroxiredoxin
LQLELSKLESLGATIVAVSPQTPEYSKKTAEENEVDFQVLSDRGNRVARQFGIGIELPVNVRQVYDRLGHDVEGANGDDTYQLPLAATYVIDTKQRIRLAFLDADHTRRVDPEEIMEVLKEVAEKAS